MFSNKKEATAIFFTLFIISNTINLFISFFFQAIPNNFGLVNVYQYPAEKKILPHTCVHAFQEVRYIF